MRASAATKLPSVHADHGLWICPTSKRVGEINTRKCVYACREPRKRDSRELPANVCQATVIPSIRFNRSTSGNEATNIFAALCEKEKLESSYALQQRPLIGERSRDKRKTISTNVLSWQLSDCGVKLLTIDVFIKPGVSLSQEKYSNLGQ
ncbi:uncharacterized protein LOC117152304 [Bombus impatiens]|uniref:Uncharacterized protein LOC117152304 n=1 Tax=Bombus impatiens TaxID=132113 RepID=A0A6P8LK68_BOMIM|nr:uncharacterized protein LOC117152304 [Bombus impatiens]